MHLNKHYIMHQLQRTVPDTRTEIYWVSWTHSNYSGFPVMTISLSAQWNSHYPPALQRALWTSAQRPRFRKQRLEPSRDTKEHLPALLAQFLCQDQHFPKQPSPALVYTCGLIKFFNFRWERKLIWGEREQGSEHRWGSHTFGLLSPKMFRLNKDELIDPARSNETNRVKCKETKRNSAAGARQTQNAQSRGWMALPGARSAAAPLPARDISHTSSSNWYLPLPHN